MGKKLEATLDFLGELFIQAVLIGRVIISIIWFLIVLAFSTFPAWGMLSLFGFKNTWMLLTNLDYIGRSGFIAGWAVIIQIILGAFFVSWVRHR